MATYQDPPAEDSYLISHWIGAPGPHSHQTLVAKTKTTYIHIIQLYCPSDAAIINDIINI